MSKLGDVLHAEGVLDEQDIEWLHLLVGDWQLLSDLAFADLVLWIRDRDGGFLAVAQCRPSTAATVFLTDQVGRRVAAGEEEPLERAWATRERVRPTEPRWQDGRPLRQEAIPVVRAGRPLGVIIRHTDAHTARIPSRLELTYLRCAHDLFTMVAAGDYPDVSAPTGPRRGAPRVGDGLIRLDFAGVVIFASPNAQSVYHRLGLVGELEGNVLADLTTALLTDRRTVDESLPLIVAGRAPWRTDVESNGVSVSLRAIPLRLKAERIGALVLCRDVSELRRRERELMSKDATIREVHHRVKNNLQTVAALLRLQARRISSPEGRDALAEAMRRVSAIALVHETLAQSIDQSVELDQIVDRALGLAADVSSATGHVRTRREGSFGKLDADRATPLMLVLNELVTNAVEHGLAGRAGTVTVTADRDDERLLVRISDDGRGIPPTGGGPGSGLGTQIVTTLTEGELGGTIKWLPGEESGTVVELTVPLA